MIAFAALRLTLSVTSVMLPLPVVRSVSPTLMTAPVPPGPAIAVTMTSPEPVVRIVFSPLPLPLAACRPLLPAPPD